MQRKIFIIMWIFTLLGGSKPKVWKISHFFSILKASLTDLCNNSAREMMMISSSLRRHWGLYCRLLEIFWGRSGLNVTSRHLAEIKSQEKARSEGEPSERTLLLEFSFWSCRYSRWTLYPGSTICQMFTFLFASTFYYKF